MKVGDLIRDIADSSLGVITRDDPENHMCQNCYLIYWISGIMRGRETSEDIHYEIDEKPWCEIVTPS